MAEKTTRTHLERAYAVAISAAQQIVEEREERHAPIITALEATPNGGLVPRHVLLVEFEKPSDKAMGAQVIRALLMRKDVDIVLLASEAWFALQQTDTALIPAGDRADRKEALVITLYAKTDALDHYDQYVAINEITRDPAPRLTVVPLPAEPNGVPGFGTFSI